MIKMNIHKALSTKKMLDKKIEKANNEIRPLGCRMKSSSTEYFTKLDIEDFNKKAKASYDKATALIKNYNKICQAITLSNAQTEVEINGVKMTVSDAINRKNNLYKEKQLLDTLKCRYRYSLEEVKNRNDKLENKIDNLREIDKKEKVDKQSTYDLMRENESWIMVDPLDIKTIISDMEDDILNFESEVDFVLSTSNAETVIEVDIDEI